MTDTETTPNAELAYKALDLIKLYPQHFDMGEWAVPAGAEWAVDLDQLTDPSHCGTTACFAGWVIALSGYQVSAGVTVYDMHGEIVHYYAPAFAAALLRIKGGADAALFYVDDKNIADAVELWFGPRPGAES